MNKKKLMEKYNINQVGGGKYGEGFFTCLKAIDDKTISLFRHDHVIKRLEFAEKNNLPLIWLKAQLKNDYKKGIGSRKPDRK